ncbi:hypothetical protein IRP63_02670 [Clostridium botulinum]|uniref:Uncharacterized protein n=1 Tax=Clostridium botulinum C/D str. DC5 TaxID=1443128 RepID=A0A0A0IDZ3_CLOBO|nr:hypothetical protein [Clostridium botulinum]KGM95355.1 hypothetical protein Z956_05135 [Clostridium botulinum D str. CCUG 7971]KGM99669.1 hypothetical protein Z955_06530 [Clostridium botulinum C/D str. DC5]KOC51590.1 hypothetical protein ADU89_13135 [Clostridium botulinum]KOC53473.1 hypothetical protein ADU90_13425 [Clostridium botulinum]MCD3234627.1 hypothetical protein [Clostridium botulinum D/C]
MVLSIDEKNQYSKYIVNSLVQKFRYSEKEAITMVKKSSIIDDISNDYDKIIRFNSDDLAQELIVKYKNTEV